MQELSVRASFQLCQILLCYVQQTRFPVFVRDEEFVCSSPKRNMHDYFGGKNMIDLHDPTLKERLRRRTAEGRYEISEIELVLNIRALQAQGDMEGCRMLCEVLLERSAPEFQHHTWGLRHRPELREEAIANMSEHLLREAMNPKEVFMTQNFIHYVRCLCVDEFNRILRQEGLRYQRDEEGRPSGRPHHVPRALIEPLQPIPVDSDALPPADVADPHDQYEQLHAHEESLRILTFLSDPMDRKIMVLRAIEGMKWDDIAVICKRTERTIRLRYERARSYLRECITREQAAYTQIPQQY
jgi:DNA-directed RNA polymerase specialized sigma24 family protein